MADDPREHVPDDLENRLDNLSSTLTDDDMETTAGTRATSVGIADADTGDSDAATRTPTATTRTPTLTTPTRSASSAEAALARAVDPVDVETFLQETGSARRSTSPAPSRGASTTSSHGTRPRRSSRRPGCGTRPSGS